MSDEQAVQSAAVAFIDAMHRREFATMGQHASVAAAEYLAVEAEFFDLLGEVEDFGEEEPPALPPARCEEVVVDGDRATATVQQDPPESEEPGMPGQQLFLTLLRENGSWGVDTVQMGEDSAPVVLADRLEKASERLAALQAERAGQMELAPLITAWLDAVQEGDFTAAEALMTPECVQREKEFRNGFTNGFRSGAIRIEDWHFGRGEIDGDEGRKTVRTVLRTADDELDREPINFRCVRTAAGWRIAEIN